MIPILHQEISVLELLRRILYDQARRSFVQVFRDLTVRAMQIVRQCLARFKVTISPLCFYGFVYLCERHCVFREAKPYYTSFFYYFGTMLSHKMHLLRADC